MTGTASTYLDSVNTTFDTLKMIGSIGSYLLTATVSTSETALVSTAVSASAVVAIDACADTEFFDTISGTCVCIANSQRNEAGVCECTEGSHSFWNEEEGVIQCRICRPELGQICQRGLLIPAPGYWHSCPNSEGGEWAPLGDSGPVDLAPVAGISLSLFEQHSHPQRTLLADVQACPNALACAGRGRAAGDNRTRASSQPSP